MKRTYLKKLAISTLASLMAVGIIPASQITAREQVTQEYNETEFINNNELFADESFIGSIEVFDLKTGEILETQYFTIEPEVVAFYSAMEHVNQLITPFSFNNRSFNLLNGGIGTTIWSGSGSGATNVRFERFIENNGAHSVFVHAMTNTLGNNIGGATLLPGSGVRFNIPALTLGYTIRANSNEAVSFLGATAVFSVWR
jgi:hypothetical protein